MAEAEEIYARSYIAYVEQICTEVANGLDPIKGMYKVRAWEDMENTPSLAQPEKEVIVSEENEKEVIVSEELKKEVSVSEENKLQSLTGAVRNLLSSIGTFEEAEKYGMGSLFAESVKWVAAIHKLAAAQAAGDGSKEDHPQAVEAEVKSKKE